MFLQTPHFEPQCGGAFPCILRVSLQEAVMGFGCAENCLVFPSTWEGPGSRSKWSAAFDVKHCCVDFRDVQFGECRQKNWTGVLEFIILLNVDTHL